jgi:hypothetical protein
VLAVIDMWLLGAADETYVSPYSTFGYVAAGRVSRAAYTVLDNEGGLRHTGPVCVRQATSQPFCHPCSDYKYLYRQTSCFEGNDILTEEGFFIDVQVRMSSHAIANMSN